MITIFKQKNDIPEDLEYIELIVYQQDVRRYLMYFISQTEFLA